MADASYTKVRGGALKMKGAVGDALVHKKKSGKRKAEDSGEEPHLRHGVWWAAKTIAQLTGHILLETDCGGYVAAVDDGTIGVGPPRPHDEAPESLPDATEIVTVVNVSEKKVAIKTAFGRYLTQEEDGSIVAKTEAMGIRELWEPLFLDSGDVVFKGNNKHYLTALPGHTVHARSEAAGEGSRYRVLSSAVRGRSRKKSDGYDVTSGSLTAMEEDHAKMFQSWMNIPRKLPEANAAALNRARKDGQLHGELLDRREKIKADKYCK